MAVFLFVSAIALCLLGYLAMSVPASWFPSASPKVWSARELGLARGAGKLEANEFVVTAPDALGAAVISLATDFHSYEYPVVAWSGIDFADNADVRLLWNSDYAKGKVQNVKLTIASGRLLPVSLAANPEWVGRIKGLALLIKGPLQQPARVQGVAIKPTGAVELLGDRAREWLTFEGWSGTSINAVAGGTDVQDLPLPTLLAVSTVLAAAAAFLLTRRRGTAHLPLIIATAFVMAWFILDARWMLNLGRQVAKTGAQYAGKDWHEKRLAAEDGPLFQFVEKAVAKMPTTPVRVFVAADAHYFRGRAAYHLYPHNVYFDPWYNSLPLAHQLHAGDYFLVYYRRGVQYDPSQQLLRWADNPPLSAEPVLVEPGAALLRIR